MAMFLPVHVTTDMAGPHSHVPTWPIRIHASTAIPAIVGVRLYILFGSNSAEAALPLESLGFLENS